MINLRVWYNSLFTSFHNNTSTISSLPVSQSPYKTSHNRLSLKLKPSKLREEIPNNSADQRQPMDPKKNEGSPLVPGKHVQSPNIFIRRPTRAIRFHSRTSRQTHPRPQGDLSLSFLAAAGLGDLRVGIVERRRRSLERGGVGELSLSP